jgi:hypothetical protein
MADREGSRTTWELEYSGLTDAEMGAFETLFEACEGRLRTFAFADPLGNLLRWTGDLSKSVWQTGLGIVGGVEDPDGGTGASTLTNGAQAPQRISQTLVSPGPYTYVFSAWVRSHGAGGVRLGLTGVGQPWWSEFPIASEWQQVSVSRTFGSSDQIACSLEVPGGKAIEVYGPQLEAQSGASGYRRTTSTSGVFRARFDQDELERVSYGPNNHSTRIRIVTVQE